MDIDLFFFIKFIVAVSSVILLSDLFERINPKIASILSGYPVGVALTLFFFGLENGEDFASRSALFSIVGIIPFLAFIGLYYLTTKIFTKLVLITSTIVATLGFLIISYGLQQIDFRLMSSAVVALAAIAILMIPFNRIRKIQTGANVRVTFKSILVKALFAGSIITAVTAIAGLVGPEWAGLLSAFPATTLPLILMVHHKYSALHLNALLKYIPVGSISIVLYLVAVYHFYPKAGIYLGTMIAYAIATVPILMLFYIENNNTIIKLREVLRMADKSTIHFVITGGTIDFHYERRFDTVVPNKVSAIPDFIRTLDYVNAKFTELFIKDSRRLSSADFNKILNTVENSPYNKIVVTTGTFKIDALFKHLEENLKDEGKVIILTGSTTPISGFSPSEGLFNLGHAVACVQTLEKGIYISFNGEIFSKSDVDRLVKEGGLAAIFQIGIQSPLI
jgi:uncharacterized membrane protein (GlpM family)